jgi:Zincin-like metallopeptidase
VPAAIVPQVCSAPIIGAVVGSPQPLQQVISYADRIGNRGQGRVHRPDTDKETRVHDIQIVELMRLAVRVQHGRLRVLAEPARPCLMGTAGDRDRGLELGSAFCCAEFGFDNDTIDNSAAYIDHWIKFLTDNETALVSAASLASKAVEFMRGLALAAPIAEAA